MIPKFCIWLLFLLSSSGHVSPFPQEADDEAEDPEMAAASVGIALSDDLEGNDDEDEGNNNLTNKTKREAVGGPKRVVNVVKTKTVMEKTPAANKTNIVDELEGIIENVEEEIAEQEKALEEWAENNSDKVNANLDKLIEVHHKLVAIATEQADKMLKTIGKITKQAGDKILDLITNNEMEIEEKLKNAEKVIEKLPAIVKQELNAKNVTKGKQMNKHS